MYRSGPVDLLRNQFLQVLKTKATYTADPILLVVLDQAVDLDWLSELKMIVVNLEDFNWSPKLYPPKYQTTKTFKDVLGHSQELHHFYKELMEMYQPIGVYTTQPKILFPCTSPLVPKKGEAIYGDVPQPPSLDICSILVN